MSCSTGAHPSHPASPSGRGGCKHLCCVNGACAQLTTTAVYILPCAISYFGQYSTALKIVNDHADTFGVGALGADLQSHVYASNYLSPDDLDDLQRQGVVGDVCTVMLREDGSYRDLEINRRATGMTPAELQRVPRRICVVSGLAKASPVLGALRAGVATDLVIDQETARAVLARMKPGIRLG